MSSCPNSPLPHRAISSQGLLFESETMASRATIASHIRSRSWPTVEDGGEEASQIDLSIDASTEVGLEFGDDGSVRLVLLSSGEGRDRRSSFLPKQAPSPVPVCPVPDPPLPILCEKPAPVPPPPPEFPPALPLLPRPPAPARGVGAPARPPEFPPPTPAPRPRPPAPAPALVPVPVPVPPPHPHSSRPPKRSQITKRVAKVFRWMLSLTLCSSGETAVANSQTTKQTKPSTEVGLGATNIGLAHIFSYQELYEATQGFREEIGDGGFSRVYSGKLRDGRKVAVKVLYEGVPRRMEQFLNEVTALSRLRHKNLVSLYGCTNPERQKLLVVYELVPNNTIFGHLHGKLPSLTWDVRMQIAIETAEALSYLHSREPPIIHRDVKTSNILLDNEFHAKVADLGMCRLMPWDTTFVSTQPQGTVGYRDPEYDELCELTPKSDAYSFGVVLLELISGKLAVDVRREETEIYLFKMALKKIFNKELDQLVDLRIGYGDNSEISRMVSSVAALSCVCLQPKADPRPTMVEVLQILKGIRDGMHSP